MDSNLVLDHVENHLVEALEHLERGRNVLSVSCFEALAAAHGCIVSALEELTMLRPGAIPEEYEVGVRREEPAA